MKCQLDARDDFYCRSYCSLNTFRAPLCPSSGAREYYTDGCCLWYLVLWFSSCRYGVELRVMCPVCGLLLLKTKAPNTTDSKNLYNTLELLMMGIVVPETCWASNKICNKNHLLHLVGILFPRLIHILYKILPVCQQPQNTSTVLNFSSHVWQIVLKYIKSADMQITKYSKQYNNMLFPNLRLKFK